MDSSKYSIVNFSTSDGLTLPGILFEPNKSTDKAAILLHGNGSTSVFYSFDDIQVMAKELNSLGISLLAFNNRGAHIIKKLKKRQSDGTVTREYFGTAYELIKDCVFDIDGAVEFLKQGKYSNFYLIGESTGANKICVYNHYHPDNEISKYVLASGGDDSGIYYQEFGDKGFQDALKQSKDMVSKGKGSEIAGAEIADVMGIMSYQSVFNTLDPDGDYNTFPFNDALNNLKLSTLPLFRYFSEIKKPTLVIYGEQDEYCYGNVPKIIELLKANTGNKEITKFVTIKDADHGFTGMYDKYAESVAKFLQS